jgi:hypothetical protein
MSYVDALDRISEIQGQIAALSGGASPAASAAPSTTSGSSFATQLAQAQGVSVPEALSGTAATSSALPASGAASALTGAAATGVGGVSSTSAAPSRLLTSAQQQFAARLSQQTGLDPHVVDSWVLAEESGGAATSRQSANNNDWLNIGYTDSGTFGSADSVWSDPITAADATAGWLAGRNTIPGYGTASSGVQGILHTAGQSPSAQISAIQGSGWASSGYPDLPQLYSQVTSG